MHICTCGYQSSSLWRRGRVVCARLRAQTFSSSNSARMNSFITTRLRGFAVELRALAASGAGAPALAAARSRMLGVVYSILLTHFGAPPASFTWAYYDKDGKCVASRIIVEFVLWLRTCSV